VRLAPDDPTEPVPYEYDLTGDVARYAFEHPPPNDRDLVVSAWREAAEVYRGRLPEVVRLWMGRPGLVLAILGGTLLAAVLVSLVPRGKSPRLGFTRPVLVVLYLMTIFAVGKVEFGAFLAPAWLAIAVRWLRSDVPHPRWERAAILVAIVSLSVRFFFRDTGHLLHPVVGVVGGVWSGFAWLVLGRIVLSMPENRESRAFRAFLTLHVFLYVQGTAALFLHTPEEARPAFLTTFGVAAAAFLWFILEEPIGRLRTRFSGRGG
jgi:hypothetical protein